MGEGLTDRVSRRLCGARFASFSGDVSMGSSAVEVFGLGVPLFILSFETPVKFEVLIFPCALPFPVGEEVLSVFNGDELLPDCSACFLGGVDGERTALPSPPFDGELAAEVESFAFVLIGEGLLVFSFVCSSGELGSGLKVLFPAPFAEGLGELDFFGAVLVGETGLFGDFVFSDSRVSQSVAKYVTIDFSSGFSTLTSVTKKRASQNVSTACSCILSLSGHLKTTLANHCTKPIVWRQGVSRR